MKVVLVGEESAAIQALRLLTGAVHDVVAVFAAQDPARASTATVAAAARMAGLEVRPPGEVTTAALGERLRTIGVDLLLNVHGLHLVHPAVLEAPRIGSFNLHPGPLPEYAGLNAPSWAILNGEQRHGVTVHWMTPEIDAGAIAYDTSFELAPDVTGLSVNIECVRRGIPLLRELIDTAARDPRAIPRRAQEPARRRYFGGEVPYGGSLPWGESAQRIAALIRACDYGPFRSPWGRPRTRSGRLGGREMRVVRATATTVDVSGAPGTVLGEEDGAVLVTAADRCVAVQRVELDGEVVEATEVLEPPDRLQ